MKNAFAGSARSIVASIFLAVILSGSIGAVCVVILPFIGSFITTLKFI